MRSIRATQAPRGHISSTAVSRALDAGRARRQRIECPRTNCDRRELPRLAERRAPCVSRVAGRGRGSRCVVHPDPTRQGQRGMGKRAVGFAPALCFRWVGKPRQSMAPPKGEARLGAEWGDGDGLLSVRGSGSHQLSPHGSDRDLGHGAGGHRCARVRERARACALGGARAREPPRVISSTLHRTTFTRPSWDG